MESAAPSYGTPMPRTVLSSNPSLDDTLESAVNNYVKTLLDAVRDLSDTVKQTRLSDYLINPAGLVDNPVLRSIVDAHLKTLGPLPAVISFVWDLSSVPPAIRSSPGFQFLYTMGCKYWPPGCNAIPKDPPLPELTNIGEPANVRDLQMALPSMGHVGNFENLRGFVQSFFEIWQKNGCRGYASSTIPIPLVCGGPGTGKTHFCRTAIRKFLDNDIEAGDDDPFKIACAFSAQKNLHIELSFRDGLIDGETACPEGSLCLRIAYEIFKGFTPFRCQYPTSHEFLSAFLSGSSSPASHLSLLDLRYFLRARLALASNDTIIFVHLDEIERIFEGSNKQESIAYFQGILDSFEDFNQWRSRVVFCTLFSGTGSAPIVAAIKTWECCCGCPFLINLDPITPKEYCQGLSDFLSMQIGHDSKPPPFKASEISKGVQGTFMDIEGVPKLFIALLHVLSCLKGPQFVSPPSAQFLDWSINRQRIREAVEDSSLSTSTILKALHTCITDSNILPSWIASDDANISMIWCYTITDTPTSPESRLDGRNEDSPTFSELEHDGKVVLRRLPLYVQGRGFHRVSFPFIFLKCILPREHLNIIPTEDSGPLYWQEVEEFDGTWLLCRLKAFQDEKWPSQPLQDFLSMESSCRQADSLISLSGPIDDSLEQLETKPHDMVNKCRRLGKTGCFGWKNVLGAGGWDWALSLPLVDAGRLLLVGKRMEGSLHPSRIEAELKKATATWFRTGMRVGYFVVLTDGVFEGTLSANVKKMTSIVDRTTMDKFFGKIMAARLQAVSDFRASV